METEKNNSRNNIKQLLKATSFYTSFSIFGPLILIGGAGLLFDRHFGTKPLITIISFLIAFVVSNFLIFKKAIALTSQISELGKKKDDSKKEE